MPSYSPPTKEFLFLLYEVFEIQKMNIPGFSEFTEDVVESILDEAGKLATEVIIPTNVKGDKFGCKLKNGIVETPEGFKEAFKIMCDAGWPALHCDKQYGGQGLPLTIATPVGEIFGAANVALYIYHALSHGVYSTILAHGTEEQKKEYLPKLVNCMWTGTMNLTEPQCGTDLNLIRTKAVRQKDGSFEITGQKIYISGGDHDLAENIIHLVLARIEKAPEGMRGISLFIVPKVLIDKNFAAANRNKISVGKVENKMGIHGNATCVMNFDGAKGFLLGDENKGVSAMFTMMNEARLATGIQGLSQAEIAYQNALQFARDRVQGKSIANRKNSSVQAEPIIVHPDVRQMLLKQKSFVEGARAFAIWSSLLIDKGKLMNDQDAIGLVSLLVPVFKAFLTDKGFESTVIAQQVFGGHGYIEDYGMSQFVRDARIAMIYEGTNGVQALDLVGRKLLLDGGKHTTSFLMRLKKFGGQKTENKHFKKDFLVPLNSAISDLETALQHFMKHGMSDPETILTGATDFLHLLGHVILGYMWANVAEKLYCHDKKIQDNEFYESKIATGKFYMNYALPETKLRLVRLLAEKELVMNIGEKGF